MNTEQKPPKNGYELLHELFQEICETAPQREVMLVGGDLVAELKSGPNEGQAIRLCFENDEAWLEFHSFRASAINVSHKDECMSKLRIAFRKVGANDPKRGDLVTQQFFSDNGDIGLMVSVRRKILPFVIGFHSKIEHLPCYSTWYPEILESVNTAIWKLQNEVDKAAEARAQ